MSIAALEAIQTTTPDQVRLMLDRLKHVAMKGGQLASEAARLIEALQADLDEARRANEAADDLLRRRRSPEEAEELRIEIRERAAKADTDRRAFVVDAIADMPWPRCVCGQEREDRAEMFVETARAEVEKRKRESHGMGRLGRFLYELDRATPPEQEMGT